MSNGALNELDSKVDIESWQQKEGNYKAELIRVIFGGKEEAGENQDKKGADGKRRRIFSRFIGA